MLFGCTRTLSESQILHGHGTARQELRDDIVRHNVELASASAELLRGWYLDNPKAVRVVLFFGDNFGTLLENAESLWRLGDALQADVVSLDYRGYGFSAGTPSLAAMLEDAPQISAFVRVLAAQRGLPIAVVGQSLGTFPAGRAAASRWVDDLILIAPASSVSELVEAVGHTFPWYRKAVTGTTLEQLGIDPLTDLASARAATLLIRGTRDSLMPPAGTKRLLQASSARQKSICEAEGGYAEMAATNPSVVRCAVDFLARANQAARCESAHTTRGR